MSVAPWLKRWNVKALVALGAGAVEAVLRGIPEGHTASIPPRLSCVGAATD